jgi:GT2 family glycosyltransferase
VSSPPLVSVVVVNRNGAAVIGRCLAHIAAQSHPAVECIVVDDGSEDASAVVVDGARARIPVILLRSAGHRGLAAGRNLGAQHANGEIVAFIDSDGYAHRHWLAASVAALTQHERLGAVAPLVFFDDRKLILNGAGGTVNRRGYARDHCFDEPFELAAAPDAVLYPMGCGMVIRRAALDEIGPLDEAIVNYYDDVELGIRLWARGWRVAVCTAAWVDHSSGAGVADAAGAAQRLLLGERHRIRTVLKYFPAAQLLPWLLQETRLLAHLRHRERRHVPFAAWGWNLRHLGSALRIRRQFAGAASAFWPLIDAAWRVQRPSIATNRWFRPERDKTGPALRLDGVADAARLNFGWHAPVADGGGAYRPTAAVASAYVRFRSPVGNCMAVWRGAAEIDAVSMTLRPAGGGEPVWHRVLAAPPASWERRRFDCSVPDGDYELLVRTMPVHRDAAGRERGIDVAAIEFTAAA